MKRMIFSGTMMAAAALISFPVAADNLPPHRAEISGNTPQAGLILPAVQHAQPAGAALPAEQMSLNYTEVKNASAGVEPDEIDNRFAQEAAHDPDCPTIGNIVRREAANALAGALFGSRADDRNRDRRTTRERLADDAIDRMTEC